jgi:hypothetical protein
MKTTFALLAACLLGTASAKAQIVLTAGDGFGTSSFNTAGHWSDSLAPSAGKTYAISYLLRTPTAAGNYNFAGDSLTINSAGSMYYKGASGYTITANIILNGGFITNGGENPYTLAGTLNLATSSSLYGFTKLVTVNSLITGGSSSTLAIRSTALSSADLTGGTILTNSANSYSGGTSVFDNASLFANADHVLGTGNVTLGARASLTLSGGLTNDYIANSASLILAANSNTVFLNFSGIDYITGLSLNNGSTYLAPGTYGAIGSGADYTYSIFTGTGMLAVIPEPSISALLLLGIVGMATRRRRS